MAKNLNIVFEISDLHLAKEISEDLKGLSSINLIHSVNETGDQGTAAFKAPPEIILVEDQPEPEQALRKLASLRKGFPLAAIFVISGDRRPEHIVEVMKAGATEYFVTPVDPAALLKAVEKVREQRARDEGAAKGHCFSFISSKGGLGATALAVNIAATLAELKTGAALADLCFQAGDGSALLDVVPASTIADLCRNFHRLDASFLKGALTRHDSGLSFLPAPHNPEDGEEVRPEHVEKICSLLRETHGCVVIDCPSMSVNDCTVQAFRASETVFIVTDLSVPAVRNAARLFQLVRKLGIQSQQVEFVVNRYIKGGPLSVEAAEKTLGKKVFWLFPNDFEDVMASINRGVPLVTLNPKAPLSRNIVEFTQKLRNPAAAGEYRGVRGTFGKAV